MGNWTSMPQLRPPSQKNPKQAVAQVLAYKDQAQGVANPDSPTLAMLKKKKKGFTNGTSG